MATYCVDWRQSFYFGNLWWNADMNCFGEYLEPFFFLLLCSFKAWRDWPPSLQMSIGFSVQSCNLLVFFLLKPLVEYCCQYFIESIYFLLMHLCQFSESAEFFYFLCSYAEFSVHFKILPVLRLMPMLQSAYLFYLLVFSGGMFSSSILVNLSFSFL